MTNILSTTILKRCFVLFISTIMFFSICLAISDAVTRFGTEVGENRIPASLDFDDIWFYDGEMVKVIPDIDLEWVSVVFTSAALIPSSSANMRVDERALRQTAKTIVSNYDELIDFFYDQNIATDVCFFKLRNGMKRNEVENFIREFNKAKSVSYAHPTVRIRNRTYAFFNAFELEWKSGVATEIRDRIMKQTHISFDKNEKVYRVDVLQIPFFRSLKLITEDIHILKATPYLVELKPSIRAELILPITGSNIGDKIPFTLTVTFSDAVTIDPSSIANLDVRPSGIQKELLEVKIDPYDYVETASKSPIHITGWLQIYTPGEFNIPPLKISYTCLSCSDNRVRSIETKQLAFKVSSIVPSKQTENTLIIPEAYLDPDYKIESYQRKANTNLVLSLSSFLIALFFISWFIKKVYTVKKENARLRIKVREDIIEENIRSFLQKDPSEPHWVYLGEISKMLREYLAAKYKLDPYPPGGTGLIFFESVKDNLPEALTFRLKNFLERIDDIVALEVNDQPDIAHFNSQLLDIIGHT